MLKKVLKYKNYNGEEVEKTHYFHLTEPELIELEGQYEGGLYNHLVGLYEAGERVKLLQMYQKLALMSYGIKSEDGEYFEKSEEITRRFEQSAAYPVFYMELMDSDEFAVEFMNSIVPEHIRIAGEKAMAEGAIPFVPDKPTGPPPRPSTALTPPSPPSS